MKRRFTTSAVAALSLIAVTACNDDGRELRAAPPPTAPVVEEPIITDAAPSGQPFAILSTALENGGTLDTRYTCDGEGAFMPLSITGVTPGMAELAVIVVDVNTDHVHWVAAGLPPTTTLVDPAVGLPDGAVLGTSSGGVVGWEPPCPAPGDQAHQYRFAVYAFAEPIGMEPGLPGADALAVLPQTATGFAELTGYYVRP